LHITREARFTGKANVLKSGIKSKRKTKATKFKKDEVQQKDVRYQE